MLVKLFEEQVDKNPQKLAVVTARNKLTYEQLNKNAGRIANGIIKNQDILEQSLNEQTVALLFEHGSDMIAGTLGALKADKIYVPLDPEYPEKRLGYMLKNSEARLIVTNNRNLTLAHKLAAQTDENIIVLNSDSIDDTASSGNIKRNISADKIAYLLYTSGSTGNPKGVIQTHGNVLHFVKSYIKKLSLTEKDRLTLFSAFSHDAAVMDIYSGLLSGATLYPLNIRQQIDIGKLAEWLEKEEITIWHSVPTLYRYFTNVLTGKESFDKLRFIVLGGESVIEHDVLTYRKYFKNSLLMNLYGQSESSYNSSYIIGMDTPFKKMILGEPVEETEILVINKDREEVAPLEIGEIVVASRYLAKGYWKEKEKTEKVFEQHPELNRLYWTGDMGRLLEDDSIEFMGRKDFQIKIRGFRVELGEIESQLLKHPLVKEAVVLGKEDLGGEKYLCAYIVGHEKLPVLEIKEYLKKELPEYMIPSYFIQLDEMPLTPNGKLDRKALPTPDKNMNIRAEYEPPRNEIEEKLVNIWEEVLGIDNIGINHSFFELGGHSLKATNMAAKIFRELNVEVPLREIFKTPTIKGIAEYIKGMEENIYASIAAIEEKEYYPASSAQKRIYTLQQFEIKSTAYNMPKIMIIEGMLDKKRLEGSFKKLIERHESLRTSFELIDEAIVQKVHKEAAFSVDYIEIGEGQTDEIVKGYIKPFDLGKAPLLRVGLIKLAEDKHILMADMHHIISDGVSMGILTKEFAELYGGKELPELRIQYKDYAAWQNEMISSEVMKKQEEHWLNTFHGEIPVLNLPTDFPRPSLQSFEGDRIGYSINKEIIEGIRRIAKETGTTMYMVLLAGFNILLSKYSGQEDIIVGSPIAGRHHTDFTNIIGMFVNTLAMRNYPIGSKTAKEFIEEVKTNALKAYENQDYQFEELVEKIGVKRDLSRNPLFDVMLVMQNTEMGEIVLNGISIKPYELQNRIAKFDITVSAVETEDSIEMSIEYCTKLYKKETIERMTGHYTNILEKVRQNPDITLEQIEMISEEEKHKLLYEFNNTYAEYPKDKTIHELFEEQVARTPDNIAAVYENRQLTYRELNEKSNQLARLLREKGVGADSIVGIMVERSLEMIIGIMGILKAGGAYLPIDPEYPEDRKQYILKDSGAKLLLVQKQTRDKTAYRGEKIELDDERLDAKDSSNLDPVSRPNDLAYIIYTSGSTGKPKGVMIENYSVINRIGWMQKEYKLTAADVILQKTPFTFDVSVWEMFWWSFTGAKVVFLNPGGEKNPHEIVQAISKYKVTIMHFVPSMLSVFMEYLKNNLEIRYIESLKIIFSSGEALTLKHVEQFNGIISENGGRKLSNLYGPTEATVDVTYYNCTEDLKYKANIPIGKPIWNTRMHIVDRNNKLQPVGVTGELCIAGDGLARGYLNRPELTAEKFVTNPFTAGQRMYRTGDLARWLPDGNIEFLGRIDSQVKIRGFRIELGEIENQLIEHEAVKEAVVIAKEEQDGSKYLCSYVVGDGQLTVTELREYLRKELPDYMIPSYFMQLEAMPLTPNGKIDRKALPEPDGKIDSSVEYEAPRNEVEEKLVKIWEEVLKVEKIGINDNFFELGGHSLRATSVAAKIHKELNVEVSLREIFKTPAIRGLSEYIKGLEKNIYASIEPIEGSGGYPTGYYQASSAQKRLYTLQQFGANNTSYNMTGVILVEGKLNISRLEDAFNNLLQRHESLRTSFELAGEEIVQQVHKEVTFKIRYEELESDNLLSGDNELSINEIEEKVREFVKAFDLSKAPLLRVGLVRLQEEKHILMYDMHHIISDGTSMGILIEEFAKLYEGKELPELRIQYKDYAAWQNKMVKSEVMKKQEEYWLKTFAKGIPVLNLPTDYPRPAIQSFEGNCIQFELDEEITGRLKRIAKETGTTMYMIILSVFNILLSKYSGQEDVVVGSPIAGRPHADLGNIMGMFVNTLAMRNQPKGTKTFRAFLEEVKANALRSYENQDYQFEELVEKLDVKRDMSRNPLFDVMFAMQNTEMGEIAIEGLRFKRYGRESKISKFDITLDAVEMGERIGLSIEYCSKLFNKETIERMTGHLRNIISRVAEDPDTELGEIEMLGEEEKQLVLKGFNSTYADYPREKTIQELFEEQVAKTPDNIAVVYVERQLTYRELNKKANQLARVLREKGVGADSIVGIMVERSLEMIVGIMGILKAGGAYLPIDAEYPRDRIDYMLEDSNAGIILTNMDTTAGCAGRETIDIRKDMAYSENGANPDPINSPQNLAYIIYTSGTTGKPKGVMVEHRNLVNIAYAWKRDYKLEEFHVRLLQMASMSFDVFAGDLVRTLLNGGRMVVCPKDVRLDPHSLYSLMKMHGINIFESTPAFVIPFMDYIYESKLELDTLKILILGSDSCPAEDFGRLLRRFSGTMRILNSYGVTEATIDSSFFETGAGYEGIGNVPIGKPMQNTKFYILDDRLKQKAIGHFGELYIGGDGIARGYLNKPELTAEKFISDPFIQGEKMYRTGDLARWLPDGNIDFLGRLDHQVKIRGFRIELGEVESHLLSHEDIKEAVVIAKDDESGNKHLCAYVVGNRELTVSELREYLLKELPEYMIPSYFMQIEKMTLTPNGKIDRKALPEPNGEINTGREYEAPRNDAEEKLVLVWQEILGINKIGISDNFFELGGDSIKAIQIMARIKKYQYMLEMQDLFKNPTIKALSRYVKRGAMISDQGKVEGDVELNPIQRWFFEQNFRDMHHYNQAVMLYSKHGFEEDRLKMVFDRILVHHDALRMRYEIKEREVRQINRGIDEKLYILDSFDLRGRENYEKEISNICDKIQGGIDLNNGPLMRLAIFNTDEGDHLLIAVHHLVIDGVSWRILFEDLSTGYGQSLKNQEIVFPPKTSSFKEWARCAKEYASSEAALKELTYWEEIENTEIKPVPKDYAVDKRSGKDVRKELIVFSKEETEALLKNTNKAYQTQINDILLTALGLSIKEWTGENEVLIELEGYGRQEVIRGVDITRTVGWFTVQYPVILDMSKSDDLASQIKQVKEGMRSIPNNGIGYGILRYLTDKKLKKGMEFKLEPEITFNYLGQFDEDVSTEVFTASRIPSGKTNSDNNESKNVIDVNGMVAEGSLSMTFAYNRNEYRQDTILSIAKTYRKNLITIIKHCCSRCRDEVEVEAAAAKEDFTWGKMDYNYEKHLEENVMVLLNEKKEKNIFVFPPITGYGLAYIPLAKLINTHSIYAFDFIEADDRTEKYIKLITGVQKEGPYILMGYCAGGNLAFEIAKGLEEKGYKVSDIILIDSDFLEDIKKDSDYFASINKMNEKRVNEIIEYARLNFLPILEYIEENVKRKIDTYSEYVEHIINTQVVNANLYNILSVSDTGSEKMNLSKLWEKSTNKSFTIYQGFGKHSDMVDYGCVEKNVEIIKGILESII